MTEEDLYKKYYDLDTRVVRVEASQKGHEDICSLRYRNIEKATFILEEKIDSISNRLITLGGTAIAVLFSVVVALGAYIWLETITSQKNNTSMILDKFKNERNKDGI